MLVTLNEILKDAQARKYAVGLFNTIDTDMLEAAISAAEEMKSPIIIGTAEVLLPFGSLKLISPSMLEAAKAARVPVAVHFDHGLTFERCLEAIRLGFSSVMFDGSLGGEKENIKNTKEMVKIAHAVGVSVEGEIGHVGEAASGDNAASDMYTTSEEALDFANETGVDALAVAIGTAHGAYKSKPKLDTERLKAIRKAVGIPLVLHGGSGLSDDDFRNTIKCGISKINIFTDICTAGTEAMSKMQGRAYIDIRNEKVRAIKEEIKRKMLLFGSDGKY